MPDYRSLAGKQESKLEVPCCSRGKENIHRLMGLWLKKTQLTEE